MQLKTFIVPSITVNLFFRSKALKKIIENARKMHDCLLTSQAHSWTVISSLVRSKSKQRMVFLTVRIKAASLM
jgi:hypothetical protein